MDKYLEKCKTLTNTEHITSHLKLISTFSLFDATNQHQHGIKQINSVTDASTFPYNSTSIQ